MRAFLYILFFIAAGIALQVALPKLLLCCFVGAALAFFGFFRGGELKRSSRAGLALGAVPAIVAMTVMPLLSSCSGKVCGATCTIVSMVGAFVIAAAACRSLSLGAVILAGFIALCLAPIGCSVMAVGASFGLAAGVALAAPVTLFLSRRSNEVA